MLQGHKKEVMSLAFMTNKMLVSTSLDNTLRVWDTDSGVTLRVLKGHTAGVFGVAADTHHLFSVSQDQNVYRWELDDLMRIVHLDGQPSSAVIAPDGDRIVIGLEDGTLRLYRLPDFSRPVKEVLKAHTKAISRLVFSRDGQFLLSAGLLTPTVNLWEVHSNQLKWKQQFTVESDGVFDIAFAPSAEMFVAVNVDGGIHLFNIREKKGHILNDLQGMDVESVAFDAKNQNLVLAIKKGFGESAGKGGVLLGKLDRGSLAGRVEVPLPTSPEYATISPDGQRVASVGSDQLLRILRRDTGKETMRLSGHKNFIRRAVFSPDGEMVATIGGDATIRMWDLLKERELFTIPLPATEDRPFPFRDFDYRCQSIPVSVSAKACWIAVPLDDKKLVLYDLSRIYN
jgi:WD40 repeat protein